MTIRIIPVYLRSNPFSPERAVCVQTNHAIHFNGNLAAQSRYMSLVSTPITNPLTEPQAARKEDSWRCEDPRRNRHHGHKPRSLQSKRLGWEG